MKEKPLSCSMDFKFIGTGGAFDVEQGNSAAWVNLNGKHILLDCGHAVYQRLRDMGLAGKIDYFLVSHFHDDHIGSLSTAILHQKHLKKPAQKAKILIPEGENGKKFQTQLYDFLAFSLIKPENFIEFIPIESISGIHTLDTSGKHVRDMLTFGFAFEDETEIVLFSGDLGDPNMVFDYAESLPQDKKMTIFHELAFWDTDGVHSHYQDLQSKTEKWDIYGYHCNPAYAPADLGIKLVANHPEFLMK